MKLLTIKRLYDELNQKNFFGILERPTILSKRWRNAWGQYCDRSGVMEFNTQQIKTIKFARDIVYHEMTHQFVNEILEANEQDDHGPIFQRTYKFFVSDEITLGNEL